MTPRRYNYGYAMPVLQENRETFAQVWLQTRSNEEAYRAAFNVRPETKQLSISSAASGMRHEPDIAARIVELQNAATALLPVTFTAATALEKWLEIANADPDELIGLRVGACRHCWGDGFGYQWKEHEYLDALADYERQCASPIKEEAAAARLPDIAGGFGFRFSAAPNADCPACEGEGKERVIARDTSKLSPGARALYGGVKQTRNGVELIIADRQKALENACRMIGAFQDKVRIDGSLQAMLGVVKLEGVDPQEASRMYMRLVGQSAA